MDAEQGKDMRTGGVPALNIERIYSTTVPAEELARALADHFRAGVRGTGLPRQRGPHGDAGTQGEPVAPSARGRLRADRCLHPGGCSAEHRPGGPRVGRYGHQRAIGLVAVPPVLLGTAYGIWKENQLDHEVWQVIDERTGVPAAAVP